MSPIHYAFVDLHKQIGESVHAQQAANLFRASRVVLRVVESLLASGPILAGLPRALCAACVGRTFARLFPAESNEARGRQLRPDAPAPSESCPLCEGLAARFDALSAFALAASRGYEFDSFLVGSVLARQIRDRELAFYADLAVRHPDQRREPVEGEAPAPAFAPAEFLKNELNRELGKRIERATGKRVEFQRPHLTFQVDTRFDHVTLQVAAVLVRARYRKHDRTLPQTRWPCRSCNGIGCRACDYKGKTYETSVEELIGGPFVAAADAVSATLHGMGREDIDARMLGSGRPFILEIRAPKKRCVDWATVGTRVAEASAGRVEVLEAATANPGDPARYKAADPDKTYRARCQAEAPIPDVNLIRVLQSFRETRLDQRTPERVAHRRADRIRNRRIHEVRLLAHEGDRFELEIRAESGTYIKEFVSGDEGRTKPSVSEAIGVKARVVELDVVDVDWKE